MLETTAENAGRRTPKRGPKGEASRRRLIDAAAFCLAQYGVQGTTFQKIAAQAGVSQALVVHYFGTTKNIFRLIVEEKMKDVQVRSQAAIEAAGTPREKLGAYLEISLQLFREAPENAKIYLMLFYLGGFEEEERALNTRLRRIATERIEAVIREGIASGEFRVKAPGVAAKLLHNALVGTLLSQVSEANPLADRLLVSSLLDLAIVFLENGAE